MKPKELKRMINELDRAKFELFDHGFTFQFIGMRRDSMDQWNVGIGDGADMTQLILVQLCNLYEHADKSKTNINDFADDVAESLKKYYPMWSDAIDLEPIGGN